MIFVTVGTHHDQFDRLVKHIDAIAPHTKEKIIVQRGFTRYVPRNCDSFDFADNLDGYFKKARVIIVQAATSVLEIVLKYKKPLIVVPRQAKFKEHINDHQVEFADYFAKKTGIASIKNVHTITSEFLATYDKKAHIDTSGLERLQTHIIELIK